MDLLARREHTRAELERKLAARGLEAGAIAEALERLQSEGLISDERFAESFLGSRVGRGHGPVRIRRDLEQRGASADAVALAFEAVDADWRVLADAARRKRFGNDRPREYREWARQARFLEGRGFTSEQIRAVLGEEG